MNTETKLTAACKTYRSHLADVLLDSAYDAAHPELRAHLNSCAPCRTEFNELRATYVLLDEFTAPEPSPYFDSKLHARLREVQAEAPEGFWERIRSFVLFSTGRSFRPAVTAALALTMVAGGAGYFTTQRPLTAAPTQASSTVNDLKVLDNNDSAEQQMGALLDMSGDEDGDSQPTT
jgi:hypothetical protein